MVAVVTQAIFFKKELRTKNKNCFEVFKRRHWPVVEWKLEELLKKKKVSVECYLTFLRKSAPKKPQAENTVDLIKKFLIAKMLLIKTGMDTANCILSSVCSNRKPSHKQKSLKILLLLHVAECFPFRGEKKNQNPQTKLIRDWLCTLQLMSTSWMIIRGHESNLLQGFSVIPILQIFQCVFKTGTIHSL